MYPAQPFAGRACRRARAQSRRRWRGGWRDARRASRARWAAPRPCARARHGQARAAGAAPRGGSQPGTATVAAHARLGSTLVTQDGCPSRWKPQARLLRFLLDSPWTARKLGGGGHDGVFKECENIYRLSHPACQAQIKNYSVLYPCDCIRAAKVSDSGPRNRRMQDYFVYSVCEECCDCMPYGARAYQYVTREEKGVPSLTSFYRGNYPAHAHYYICNSSSDLA